MKILAIETSCDDTGIAILEANNNVNFKVLSNIVASQIKVHQKYGGVYPMMAKREHQNNLVPVLVRALKQAKLLNPKSQNPNPKTNEIKNILEREPELLKKITSFFKKYKKPDIDLISVTNGPGLEPCLWVGVNFAKALSYFWDIPVVPVDHIESHILVNLLPQINENPKSEAQNPKIKFPAIALVVSGGHTQIILVKKIKDYKILGETRDDAAGECFDKCAKLLGLGYPGGPIIAAIAAKSEIRNPKSEKNFKLPRPMIGTKDYDFSFSGLKTAVLYADRKVQNKNKQYKQGMAAEVQQAIIDVLIKKTIKAVKDFNVKSLILGGGVSANSALREQLAQKIQDARNNNQTINFLVPPKNLSADNGLMVAITGFYHKNETVPWQTIQADGNLRVSR